MPPHMKTRDVVKKLLKAGWECKPGYHKHLNMVKGDKKVPIPYHASKEIPVGTLLAIEKQTGVTLIDRKPKK